MIFKTSIHKPKIRIIFICQTMMFFCLPQTADPFNEKALRAALGATFKIPLAQGTWDDLEVIAVRENLKPLAADLSGTPFDQVEKKQPILLILGSEAHGLSNEAKINTQRVTIPMGKEMESLNVSIAGAILLYGLKHAL